MVQECKVLKSSANDGSWKSPLIRKFLFDLHSVFLDTCSLDRELSLEQAMCVSGKYLDVIHNTLMEFNAKSDFGEIYKNLSDAEILWSLVESIYIRPKDSPIVMDLIEWGAFCFGRVREGILQQLKDESAVPETRDFYWNAIILSIIQVDFQSASILLRRHSRFQQDASFEQMCMYLESFQLFINGKMFNVGEFIEIQKRLRDALRAGLFKKVTHLEAIACLMIGNLEAFIKYARQLYDKWYELLPAYVLFSCPGTTLETVSRVAQTLFDALCANQTASAAEKMDSEIDWAIFTILKKKCPEFLKYLCDTSIQGWFPAHLCDLLERHDPSIIVSLSELHSWNGPLSKKRKETMMDENCIPLNAPSEVSSIYPYIMSDYATLLWQSRLHWDIAVDYVGVNAAPLLDSMLSSVDLTSIRKAERVYSMAVRFESKFAAHKVAEKLVSRYLISRSFNEALSWSLRSNVADLISKVSNTILISLNAEEISQLRIFDAIANAFLSYPSLLILQRFYQFRKSLMNGQVADATDKLYELVTSGMAPVSFQTILFDQMTKLLDPSSIEYIQAPQLDRSSICDLMKAVNIYVIQNAILNPKSAGSDPVSTELEAKIKIVRSTLCDVLAKKALE